MSFMILIPVSIGMGAIGLVGFLWALDHHQFDDLEGAAWRAISNDTESQTPADEKE